MLGKPCCVFFLAVCVFASLRPLFEGRELLIIGICLPYAYGMSYGFAPTIRGVHNAYLFSLSDRDAVIFSSGFSKL